MASKLLTFLTISNIGVVINDRAKTITKVNKTKDGLLYLFTREVNTKDTPKDPMIEITKKNPISASETS